MFFIDSFKTRHIPVWNKDEDKECIDWTIFDSMRKYYDQNAVWWGKTEIITCFRGNKTFYMYFPLTYNFFVILSSSTTHTFSSVTKSRLVWTVSVQWLQFSLSRLYQNQEKLSWLLCINRLHNSSICSTISFSYPMGT